MILQDSRYTVLDLRRTIIISLENPFMKF